MSFFSLFPIPIFLDFPSFLLSESKRRCWGWWMPCLPTALPATMFLWVFHSNHRSQQRKPPSCTKLPTSTAPPHLTACHHQRVVARPVRELREGHGDVWKGGAHASTSKCPESRRWRRLSVTALVRRLFSYAKSWHSVQWGVLLGNLKGNMKKTNKQTRRRWWWDEESATMTI